MPGNLNFCFAKIKSPPSPEPQSLNTDPSTTTAAAASPDLTAAFASQRFFCSSPGRSKSIIDSTTTLSFASTSAATSASLGTRNNAAVDAVPTYSPDPYVDFRRSMQEMVDAREVHRGGRESCWDYLHELLMCYLSLNPKSTHKFIIAAFADVVVGLLTPSSPPVANDQRFSGLI